MKHTLLTLAALSAAALSASAQITLNDAYSFIADMHPMTTSSSKSVNVLGCTISNPKCASVSNYKGQADVKTEFINIVESLPIQQQVFGVNNGEEMVVVYATPRGNNTYNVLILESDSQNGNYTAYYGQANQSGVNAIGNNRIIMDSNTLNISNPTAANVAQLTK